MAVNSVSSSESVRIEQRRNDEAKAVEQKKTTQVNREVEDNHKAAEQGRGKAVDVTA